LGLNIIVGVKWVPNTQAVSIDPKTGTLIREGVPSIVNPHDLNAVELALQIKDKYGGSVTVISMAPPSAKLGQEHCIGMGVDRGILVSDRAFAGADTLATSYTLAKAIEKIGNYDLIIMGQETIDSSTAHIGAQVASWLGIPYIYYVVDFQYLEDKQVIRVKRILEDAYETYEVKLPALISAAMKSNYPRRIKLANKIRAKMEKPIDVWTNELLKLNPNLIGLKGSPTTVFKIETVPVVPRKKEVHCVIDDKEAARWLLDKLTSEGLIKI
jgi:electron transfer flavoprotein beta subunit